MEIKHDNILYVSDIAEIGGVETFVFEMVKKYKDLDIAVVYKTASKNQLCRIEQYCRTYKFTGQTIRCKVAVINYDSSIVDFIKEGKIYMTIHADYTDPAYKSYPYLDERITGYIGITKYICESFEKKFGKKCMLSYNPLFIEDKKRLVLVSATRLSRVKGRDRMIKLADALDKANIDYVWYVFTNDTKEMSNENVIYMKPRLDAYKWIKEADYLVQLSDTEACSYAINEALYQNTAIIVTPLPYLSEIGVKDGKNAYIMNFDCSNVDEIVEKIEKVPKFEFEPLKDNYNKILAKGKSKYIVELNTMVKVKCIQTYKDLIMNRIVKATDNEIFEVNLLRAEYLEGLGVVERYHEKETVKKRRIIDMGYSSVRQSVYAEIEKEIRLKKAFMCSKCELFIDDKCTNSGTCVHEIRKGVKISEDSKSKNVRLKVRRIQSKS